MKQYAYAYYRSKLQGNVSLMAFADHAPASLWRDQHIVYQRCSAVVLAENDDQARTLLAKIDALRGRLAMRSDGAPRSEPSA